MKKINIIPLLLAALLPGVAGCYKMDVPEAARPDTVVRMTLDGDPYAAKEALTVRYQGSETLTFSYTGISRIVAQGPKGWEVTVSMSAGTGTIKVFAPKYGTEQFDAEGEILLKMYDGTGSFKEKKIPVRAVEDPLTFTISDPSFDPSKPMAFTLGSRNTVSFDASLSFKEFQVTLPKGWKAEQKTPGVLTIIAPDLTVEEGEASGTVTVIPVSWTGVVGTEQALSFPVSEDAGKPTFQFVDAEVSFKPGEHKVLGITAKGVKDITGMITPRGWTVDWSKMTSEGTIDVTAPASTAEADGAATLVLSATSGVDNAPMTTGGCTIRLWGINNKAELLAFRSLYQGDDAGDERMAAPDVENPALAKYLVDGVILLNGDIALTTADLVAGSFIFKTLALPINGQGHAIDMDFTSGAAKTGLFETSLASVTDAEDLLVEKLRLTGKIVNTNAASVANVGALICNPNTLTVEDCTSSVDITFDVPGSTLQKAVIGGLAGQVASNASPVFRKCTFDGNIVLKSNVFAAGGIIGGTDTGKPGGNTTIEDCDFKGTLTMDIHSTQTTVTSRIGGLLGEIARQGLIKDSRSSGTLTVNCNGFKLSANNGFGVGGCVGRITAPASGYTMAATLSNLAFSGTINIKGSPGEDEGRIGQILGCSPNANSDGILKKDGWQENGTINQ